MTCHPCERGEHRFCAVGNCDFCPPCGRAREQARNPNPEPTPEQAVRALKILGEWTRRGFWHEVSPEGGCGPIKNRLVLFSYADPARAHGSNDPDPPSSLGINYFDALCQATTVMQVLLELHPEPKAEKR